MSSEYHISVLVDNQVAFAAPLSGPLELGRQQPGEPEPFQLVTTPDGPRLVIASGGDLGVSRRQMRVQPLPNDRLEIVNLSASAALPLMARPALSPGQQTVMELPCSVTVGSRIFLNFSLHQEQTPLKELPEATILPGRAFRDVREDLRSPVFGAAKTPEPLVQALQVVMDLFLSACSEAELFHSALDGALALIGFDTVRILRPQEGDWREALARSALQESSVLPPPSRQVLQSVRERKRTFWETRMENPATASLSQVTGVIGAPILDAQGDVIGVLYGDRRRDSSTSISGEIAPLDARLMELLACGIASGLARLQQQARAEQMRLQFAQFFTPELAAELEQNPGLLHGQDAEVSLLFCDIRGFSRISERIGATETFHWIHDVMDRLSDCILSHNGVLVDYIGDEVMAMWGAPQPQPDHAESACRAALAMLATLPELNGRWQERLGESIELSIGINSGMVKVGNAGSRHKFKYSPLGNAVNLASRVVGVTRHLKTSLLVTGETSRQLPEALRRRKLCDVQVMNVEEPVELFELMTGEVPEQLLHDYEQSRIAFEKKEFRAAAHLTARLLEQFPDDGPSLVLLSRAVQILVDGPPPDHPVWRLNAK